MCSSLMSRYRRICSSRWWRRSTVSSRPLRRTWPGTGNNLIVYFVARIFVNYILTIFFSAVSPGSEKSAPHVIYGAKQSPDSGYVSSRGMTMLDSPGFDSGGKFIAAPMSAGASDLGPSGNYAAVGQASAGRNHSSTYSSGRSSLDSRDVVTADVTIPRPAVTENNLRYPSPNMTTVSGRKYMDELAGGCCKSEDRFTASVAPSGFGSSPQQSSTPAAAAMSLTMTGTGT